MQSKEEVRARIDVLVTEMKAMKEQRASDLFAHIEDIRSSVRKCREIKILYGVIEEPFPEDTRSLLIHGFS